MEINCEFSISDWNGKHYACSVNEPNITEKYHVIKKFKGNHEKGYHQKDVQRIYFSAKSTKMNYFPRGLHKHFPNLRHLTISDCGIKEISKSDLKGLDGLFSLTIRTCHLTSLPDDLFTEMPNLRDVFFSDNEIEFASSEVLKPLLGRGWNVKVSLRRNKHIDAEYYRKGDRGSLDSLEDLMKLIDVRCTKPTLPTFVPDPLDANSLLTEMWVSGRFSDVTIIARDKEFKVHKAILGMKSEVFAQIFEDQIEEKLPGCSSESVETLLKFIYTNEMPEDGNAKENFEIADKFKVAAMKTFYEKIIGDQVNESSAWETFLYAHRFSSQLIKQKAFELIAEKIPDVSDCLIEDPVNLKKLIDAREVYEEILEKSKKLAFS